MVQAAAFSTYTIAEAAGRLPGYADARNHKTRTIFCISRQRYTEAFRDAIS